MSTLYNGSVLKMELDSKSSRDNPETQGIEASASRQDTASTSDQRPIRFGVMFNGNYLHQWQALCVDNLLALNGVELGLFIVDKGDGSLTFLDKIKEVPLNNLLFHLYRKLPPSSRAIGRVSMADYLQTVPSITSRPIRKGKFSQYFTDDDLQTIRSHNLDFILRFAFGIIRGGILNVTPWGVWSFHHDDEEKFRGGPPCFWEMYTGEKLTGAILQRLTSRLDGGVVLKKGFVTTHRTSYNRSFDNVAFESAHWPAEVCQDIRSGNAAYLDAKPSQTSAPVYNTPNSLTMMMFMSKLIKNRLLGR
jgi:hypothetical protein